MSSRDRNASIDNTWYGRPAMYLSYLAGASLTYLLFRALWGQYILTDMNALMGTGMVVWEGLGKVWFIFVWGFGITLILGLVLRRYVYNEASRSKQVLKGIWTSLNAGFFEEIIFRGFLFMNTMVMMVFFNAITFGLVRWVNENIMIPVTDWVTFYTLHEQLVNHGEWYFGAAIISAAAAFRDAHKGLGYLGWLNAWWIGLVMFFLTFNYGLPTAIAAHIIYDVIVFTVAALVSRKPDPLELAIANIIDRL